MALFEPDREYGFPTELAAYADLVTHGCYPLVKDGTIEQVAGMPHSNADWIGNNPKAATAEFLANRPDFQRARPPRTFDETQEAPDCTHSSDGWLRCKA